MKVLVADDDRVARKVLRAFLEDACYEVVTVEDGKQAIELLVGSEAPLIVILDWVMPGMSGPEVCTRLRAAHLKWRPYVLMLSAKTDKNEVVAGLDAGADDFLSKPFNLAELLARLRVAQRMVEYEVELHQKIAELEALEQRHQLLGDLIANQTPAADAAVAPPTEPAKLKSSVTPEQAGSLAAVALEQLGLGEVRAVQPPADFQPARETYAAWVALVAADEHHWVDLVLEIDPAVVGALIEKTLPRRSNNSPPRHVFVAEALTIVASALRSELRQRTCDTIMPYLSRGMLIERHRQRLPIPDEIHPIHLDLAGHPVRVTIVEQNNPIRRKTSTQLRHLDVLAAAYPPPNVNEVALLNRGAILNDRYIEKLTAFAEATSEQHPIPVYVPTPLTLFFNNEGGS